MIFRLATGFGGYAREPGLPGITEFEGLNTKVAMVAGR
jgi:hypothetical protein